MVRGTLITNSGCIKDSGNAALALADRAMTYGGGEKGYTDYPAL